MEYIKYSGAIAIAIVFYRLKSIQSMALLTFMASYYLVLIFSQIVGAELDVFTTYDTDDSRAYLLDLMSGFFVALCFGSFVKIKNKINIEYSAFLADLALCLLLFLIIYEFYLSSFAGLKGDYSNETKATYFFSYLSVIFAFYLYFAPRVRLVFYLMIIVHMSLCVVNGERLMIITTLLTILFFVGPQKINLKYCLLGMLFLVVLFFMDDLRSSNTSNSSDIASKFIFDGAVTHHGSLLYSSLVLLNYGLENPFGIGMESAVSYLLGLDGSTGVSGMSGFAFSLDVFAKRGGGGLAPSYLVALFGIGIGSVLSLVLGFIIGRSMMLFEKGSCGPVLLLMLGFLPHAFAYTPIHFFKGPLMLLFIIIAGKLTLKVIRG
jgi:hypothetical protein